MLTHTQTPSSSEFSIIATCDALIAGIVDRSGVVNSDERCEVTRSTVLCNLTTRQKLPMRK
jgi:hypothetical protein